MHDKTPCGHAVQRQTAQRSIERLPSFDARFGEGPFVHFRRNVEESILTLERLCDIALPEENIPLLTGQRIDDGVVAVLLIIIVGLFRLESGVNQ